MSVQLLRIFSVAVAVATLVLEDELIERGAGHIVLWCAGWRTQAYCLSCKVRVRHT